MILKKQGQNVLQLPLFTIPLTPPLPLTTAGSPYVQSSLSKSDKKNQHFRNKNSPMLDYNDIEKESLTET